MTRPSLTAAVTAVMPPPPRPRRAPVPRPYPVSARKTSSSVGRRRPTSSTLIRSSPSRRTTSTSCAAPPSAAIVSRRVCRSTAPVPSGEQRDARSSASRSCDDLDPLPADLRLQLVRRSARDDPAVVDDRDLVGELVGLLEVLRRQQERRAFAHLGADHVPHREPAARIEPGRRLVEEEQPRLADQGAREVEPAAHPAGVGLRDPSGRVGEVEALEQRVGPAPRLGAAELVQPRTSRGSRARSGSRRSPRTGRRGRSGGVPPGRRERRRARRRALPASGLSSVVRMRTVVVLPAPFGPSRPSTVPSRTSRSTPSSARTSFFPER